MLLRLAFAALVLSAAPACSASGGASGQLSDDTTYAVQLLARAGVTVERAQIERVLRDSLETVVWIERRIGALPVFDHQLGYSFEGDGPPTLLGEPLPPAPPGLVVQPRVTAYQARDVFAQRAAREQWVIARDDLFDLVLGYVVEPGPHPYRLVWRVRHTAAGAAVVVVDAINGAELSWDSGIRCFRAPCP